MTSATIRPASDYPPGGDGSALFKDVKHLLKLSHIG